MKPLFIPLKREYFDAFVTGRKDEEYRPYGTRWNEQTCPVGRKVVLSLGYGNKRRATGEIVGFRQSKMVPLRSEWKACYGEKNYKTAACIKIKLDLKT